MGNTKEAKTVEYVDVASVQLAIAQDDDGKWIYENESGIAIYSNTTISVTSDVAVTVRVTPPDSSLDTRDVEQPGFQIMGVEPGGWEPREFSTDGISYEVTDEVEGRSFTVKLAYADSENPATDSVRVDPVFTLKKTSSTGGK